MGNWPTAIKQDNRGTGGGITFVSVTATVMSIRGGKYYVFKEDTNRIKFPNGNEGRPGWGWDGTAFAEDTVVDVDLALGPKKMRDSEEIDSNDPWWFNVKAMVLSETQPAAPPPEAIQAAGSGAKDFDVIGYTLGGIAVAAKDGPQGWMGYLTRLSTLAQALASIAATTKDPNDIETAKAAIQYAAHENQEWGDFLRPYMFPETTPDAAQSDDQQETPPTQQGLPDLPTPTDEEQVLPW